MANISKTFRKEGSLWPRRSINGNGRRDGIGISTWSDNVSKIILPAKSPIFYS